MLLLCVINERLNESEPHWLKMSDECKNIIAFNHGRALAGVWHCSISGLAPPPGLEHAASIARSSAVPTVLGTPATVPKAEHALRMRPREIVPPPTSTIPVARIASVTSTVPQAPPRESGDGPIFASITGERASRADSFKIDSSDETSGQEFTRKRTAVKTIDLGSAPTAGAFRLWLNDLYSSCCAASNRPQRRTIKYIRTVEACQDPSVFTTVPRKWQTFDSELFGAVMRYVSGELKRALLNYREACYRDGSQPSGRWSLWHALQRYMLERGTATQVDLTALMSHEYRNDLSVYLDGLDTILMHLQQPPEEDLLHACVEPQLRKCKALELDLKIYDRAAEGSEERSVQYLYKCAREHLARKHLQDVKDSLLRAPLKATPAKAPQAEAKGGKTEDGAVAKPEICRNFLAGRCTNGDSCHALMSHPRHLLHSPRAVTIRIQRSRLISACRLEKAILADMVKTAFSAIFPCRLPKGMSRPLLLVRRWSGL